MFVKKTYKNDMKLSILHKLRGIKTIGNENNISEVQKNIT